MAILVAIGWGSVLSGLAGCINTEFGCKGYPEGARCQAVSQILSQDPEQTGGYLSDDGRRNGGRPGAAPAGPLSEPPRSTRSNGSGDVAVVGPAPLELGKPIVRPPQVIRAWLAPWRDHQDRLHEASYVYIMIDPAEWAYTGPMLGLSRHERARTSGLPKAPSMPPGRERAPSGTGAANGQGAAAPSGRPSSQAAGVAPAQTPPAPASPPSHAASVVPPVLMVPGAQGPRPVPIPQVGLDMWGE